MRNFRAISLFALPLLLVSFSCDLSNNPLISSSSPSPSVSPSPSSSLSPNTSVSSSVSLNASTIQTRADFIKAYQCVIDNSSISEDKKIAARATLTVINNSLVTDASFALVKENYRQFLLGLDLSSCGFASTVVSQTKITGTGDNTSEKSCDQEGTIKSLTGPSINVSFINNTNQTLKIYWLDMTGKRVSYNNSLKAGAKHPQQTFVTHPWLIADANDKCLGIYTFSNNASLTLGNGATSSTTSGSTTGNGSVTGTVTTGTSTVVVGTATPLALENNMARLPGVILNTSSEYSTAWNKNRLLDGNLGTSWFTAVGDAANLGKTPYIEIIFPKPITMKGINLKGNREYSSGYDIFEGNVLVNSATGQTTYSVKFPEPDRDFDIKFNQEIKNVSSVKFEVTKDESTEPGLSEIEVDGYQ